MGNVIGDPLGATPLVVESAESPAARILRLLEEGGDDSREARALAVFDALRAWRAAGGEIRLEAGAPVRPVVPRAPVAESPALLGTILDGLVFSTDDEIEVLRLHASIRDSERWRLLPRELQRGVVALCAARLRRLQDDRRLIHPRLEESFSMLTAFSKREQPGYVVGLSRHHKSVRTSWEEDADAWWERLRSPITPDMAAPPATLQDRLLAALAAAVAEYLAAPEEGRESAAAVVVRRTRDALSGGVSSRDARIVRTCTPVVALLEGEEFRRLGRSIRGEVDEAPAEPTEDQSPPSAEWGWWGRTRARRAVLVGGTPMEIARQRVQRAFQFSELEWLSGDDRASALGQVRERVRAGKVDLVIVVGPGSAADVEEILVPACRERGVDWVQVEKGYSVAGIRAAIERSIPSVT